MGRGRNRGRGVPATPQPLGRTAPPPGTHLGDLSPDVDELDVRFGWFGADFRVHPELSDLAAIEFADKAMKAGIDEDDPRAMTLIKDSIGLYVHPDDFDEFWRLAVRHRVGSERLMAAMKTLVEMVAGRPTGRSTDSSDGPPNTQVNSKAGSSSPVIQRMERQGRADLALVYMEADAAQAAG